MLMITLELILINFSLDIQIVKLILFCCYLAKASITFSLLPQYLPVTKNVKEFCEKYYLSHDLNLEGGGGRI